MASSGWNDWLDLAVANLDQTKLLRSLRPVQCAVVTPPPVRVSQSEESLEDSQGGACACAVSSKECRSSVVRMEADSGLSSGMCIVNDWSDEQIWACNRSAVEVSVSEGTFQSWLNGASTSGIQLVLCLLLYAHFYFILSG